MRNVLTSILVAIFLFVGLSLAFAEVRVKQKGTDKGQAITLDFRNGPEVSRSGGTVTIDFSAMNWTDATVLLRGASVNWTDSRIISQTASINWTDTKFYDTTSINWSDLYGATGSGGKQIWVQADGKIYAP